ncbi:MAG: hemerythrin domain-containing protein [Gemmatimonadota bacterium]|nr:hemerythrin domain-containing protein [Gemmatimonadota bacterium]
MKSVDFLMEEHRVIERVISVLEAGAQKIHACETVDPKIFVDAVEFVRDFADGCHHQKEEGVLFRYMVEAGMPESEGPIAVMFSEHSRAREYTRALAAAAERMVAGDSQAATAVMANARGYAALLREHIAKEDAILFPMASQVLSGQLKERCEEDFEKIRVEETSRHQKLRALADKLEQRMAS